MTKNGLVVEYRKIADLKFPPNTVRIHNRAQRRKASAILRKFDQVLPIIVDSQGQIIDGQMVVEELKKLGCDEVATVVVANRDPGELRALRLALNRLPEDTQWNPAGLKLEFEVLLDLGFDMLLTAFEPVEIDGILLLEELKIGVVEDAPPTLAPNRVAISKLGDVWVTGPHRILCGDARDQNCVLRLMAGASAQMVFTDPPYNIAIAGFVGGLGKHKHRDFEMASGELSSEQFIDFLASFFEAACAVLQDGAIVYACIDWRHLAEMLSAARHAGLVQLNLCVWAKTNASMGTFYRSQHELVPVFKKGTAPHINNFELGQKGRSRSNVWTCRGMNVVGAERDELLALHPTVKPLALVVDAIKDVSHRNGIVFDPFLGSGTTLIAAEATGRRCYGIELDPLYVDLIIRRWESYSGGTAVHAETGETFSDRERAIEQENANPAPLLLGPSETEH